MEHVKCLIVGSGPAGYTAAIYASRANLQPVEYAGIQPGGQLTQTTIVENFPGYPQGVDGNQMMMDIREQAERFGADIRDGIIVKADLSKQPYVLTTEEGHEISADTVIIATGASAKYLGLADEAKYRGEGVSACATCDRGCSGRRRHRLRGCPLSVHTSQEGLPHRAQAVPPCLESDAGAREECREY